ncbi:MAG: diacylglycerol kinase family lipid kinase [Brevefilum sp.]|nr:diacylglycerol kinase family lipid kinase [Brevefilum sp.]
MAKKAVLFYNPQSGHSKGNHQCDEIRTHFIQHGIDLETVIVPLPHDEIKSIVDSAISNRVDLFIAAGGDGTVSMISTHLVGKDYPLGIIPLGTGNLLSKVLNIPQKLEEALALITNEEYDQVKIDTIKLGDRYYMLNVSIGVSPKIMESVDSNQKQKLGVFAYLINFIQQILGLKLHRVFIECDHQKSSHLASEILITNIGTAGVEPLMWSEDISLNDGKMDLLIIRATNIRDLFRLIVSIFTKKSKLYSKIKFFNVDDYCRIESQSPLHIQADGDIIGETPFEIHVIPSSLTLIAGK